MADNLKTSNDFLNLNVRLFQNKKNGQISIALPKRKLKGNGDEQIPDSVKIKLFKWWKKE